MEGYGRAKETIRRDGWYGKKKRDMVEQERQSLHLEGIVEEKDMVEQGKQGLQMEGIVEKEDMVESDRQDLRRVASMIYSPTHQ